MLVARWGFFLLLLLTGLLVWFNPLTPARLALWLGGWAG